MEIKSHVWGLEQDAGVKAKQAVAADTAVTATPPPATSKWRLV